MNAKQLKQQRISGIMSKQKQDQTFEMILSPLLI